MSRRSKLDEVWPEATVEVHPADAARLGVGTGDWLRATSRRGSIGLRAMVTESEALPVAGANRARRTPQNVQRAFTP